MFFSKSYEIKTNLIGNRYWGKRSAYGWIPLKNHRNKDPILKRKDGYVFALFLKISHILNLYKKIDKKLKIDMDG